ncbi:DUF1284 domain-containing protein [Pseudobutyrivibrio xylanivorans]|uniref:DUF1284 domain-containing protein n=1 Tax=Pseudobutyrivibrio xylanivorans TaxID=185007 RepID=A0A5P6VNJ2_PSEXY|nr:DUF1284 domain-containing protein [Pseudobutyrivibrio xylanivorans]QFJ54233.1 DUF1284 domain-containing protein [Pseudobutyrivibrio xylanivorans]
MTFEKQINIRPHHLLCIQKYTGHGYDGTFTNHMNNMIETLSDEMIVTLHEGCDDLCIACPNNEDGKCTSLDKVRYMDESVLKTCGLTYGYTSSWKSLADVAKEKIFETDEFYNICHNCEWFELCNNTPLQTIH